MEHLRAEPIPWLLEMDDPSVRYFTLRDILGRDEADEEMVAAREAIMTSAPVRTILEAQYPAGYWVRPGRGYSPKYKATLWQIIFLAELGATRTEAIERACEHALEQALLSEAGLFSAWRSPAGAFLCLNGALLGAYLHFGYGEDPRIKSLARALAERVVRDGFRCRYNSASPKDRSAWQPCAWGAVKVLKALTQMKPFQMPEGATHPSPSPACGGGLGWGEASHLRRAIEAGLEFLCSHDALSYPGPRGKSRLWLKFGFPLGMTSDLVELLDLMAGLGHNCQSQALEFILSKGDERGRWKLERTLPKMWVRLERRGQPSKFVTLRVVRLLRK
ncbi:MAG: hypothetical protein ACUVV0_05000 [Anaerolineae bacterium]